MIKETIIIRKDLNMRKGKMIAQGSHAAMSFLVNKIKNGSEFTEQEKEWMDGKFTKICLYVNSESELMEVHEEAIKSGLSSYLIVDAGDTEFHGVPTPTCIAIGPDEAEKIDKITGDLKLL